MRVNTDPLGSTSIVIDKATSELVERATYLAFGQAETDYRPERWRSFREDYRFTGKEDDVGSGLTYFGARYYISARAVGECRPADSAWSRERLEPVCVRDGIAAAIR